MTSERRRSPFELACVGFYRMAAIMHTEDAMCQMNYAICLQWYRHDYSQSEEFYQRAARLTLGRDPLIMFNYNWMLKHLMQVDRSGEDALFEESKQQASADIAVWNEQRKADEQLMHAIDNAAALTIQYRFRLRRKGLLHYWPFRLPSYRDTKQKLIDSNKALYPTGTAQAAAAVEVYANPDEWERCHDGHSNYYYYNVRTMESSWECPTFQVQVCLNSHF